MKEKRLIDYNVLLKKYEDNPELAKAFKEFMDYQEQTETLRDELIIENVKLMQERAKEKKRIAYFRHEIINSLGASKGLIQFLIEDYDRLNDDQKKEYLDLISKCAEKGNNLSSFLYSKENIPKSNFSIEKIVLNDAEVAEKEIMEIDKIGINIRYQDKYGKPIEIYSSITDFEAMLGTLLSNSIAWNPKYARIEEAFRIDKGNNLEILFENKKSPDKLREKGMGEGYGTQMIKEIVGDLGGEFHNYSKSLIIPNANQNFYDQMKSFGNKKAIDNIQKDDEIFGTLIKVPMKSLSKQ
jgi:signal transduction histidine kinase